MIRVLLLADPNSSHVLKWANSLNDAGLEISIFSFSECNKAMFNKNINIDTFKISDSIKWKADGNLLKSIYLLALPKLKKVLKNNFPIILHAHSASSYGMLGALCGYKPFLISVWGNDVYNFPRKSFLLKKILEYNLSKAEKIFSTSNVMADETKKYSNVEVEVINFGVDTDFFKPAEKKVYFLQSDIVIGTVKSLEPKYGIFDLVDAYKLLIDKFPNLPLKLLIVGRGSLEQKLGKYLQELNLTDKAIITGFVSFDKIPQMHNTLDIMIAVSVEESETFGVSVLESSACGKPVIVSNVGGLPEVVENEVTGIIVPPNRPDILALEIEKLIKDKKLRKAMGIAGRKRVEKKFNWNDNVEQMISNYKYFWNKYFE
jgi:glycosyltransferase involved in cell wall biosynthesis